jgi:uncharacterized membrane protein YccC
MKMLTREQWLYCLQIGLSMVLAFYVTHGRDPTNAIYAVLGAGLVTAPSIGEGVGVSRDRIIGTLLGAVVSLTTMWVHDPALALGLTVVVVAPLGMLIGGIAVTRIAVTVMAVTVVLHTESAGSYGFYRFTNTVAGVAVALAVSFVLWPLSGKLNHSATLRAILSAAARLAERLTSCDPKGVPLEAQKKLFGALSSLPKSMTHLRLDPLLYRERGRLQQEALIIVKISIALLSTSLVLARTNMETRPAELELMRAFYRHIGARLRWALLAYPRDGAAMTDTLEAPPVLAASSTTPLPILLVFEELQVIECWLDELRALLLQRAET